MLKIIVLCTMLLSSLVHAQEFRLGHIYDSQHPWHKSAVQIAEKIKKETDGRVDIKIFPSSTLGTEQELMEQVITSGLDMAIISSGQLGNVFEPMIVTEMPYIFRDTDHLMTFFESEIAQEMFDDFHEKFNSYLVGSSSWGVRHILGNKAIKTPKDLDNFKLRTPEQKSTIDYAKALGSTPTPVSYAEAYLALQQNLVDGLENPLTSIQTMKFFEAAKHLSLTGHVITAMHFVLNGEALDNMSSKDKEIVFNIFNHSGRKTAQMVVDQDKEMRAVLEEEGVIFSEVDIDSFRNKTISMSINYADKWKEYGDLYNIISKM